MSRTSVHCSYILARYQAHLSRFHQEKSAAVHSVPEFLVQLLHQNSPYVIIVIDHLARKCPVVSPNFEALLQWPADLLQTDNMRWMERLLHPTDGQLLAKMLPSLCTKILTLSPTERDGLRISACLRISRPDQTYFWAMVQIRPLLYDERGFSLADALLISDISYLKKDDRVVLEVRTATEAFQQETPPIFAMQSAVNVPTLTRREKEIARLMLEGKDTPQIATIMKISIQTVYTYRKNLLAKTNTSNATEMLAFLVQHQLI